jgi:hypothetical protein
LLTSGYSLLGSGAKREYLMNDELGCQSHPNSSFIKYSYSGYEDLCPGKVFIITVRYFIDLWCLFTANAPKRIPSNIQVDDKKHQAKVAKKLAKQQAPPRTEVQKQVKMFSHLHQFKREVSLTAHLSFASGGIHPAILRLGLQYADGKICGSNARCVGLLGAFKKVVSDYVTPPDKALARDLDARIKPYIT